MLFKDKILDVVKQSKLSALDNSQAIIEFTPDGKILSANKNFLEALGYTMSEIEGQHHSMFVAPEDRQLLSYKEFWEKLKKGDFQQAEYLRFGKGGRPIWIQATYNPLKDAKGDVFAVVKFATDSTAQKMKTMEDDAQLAAIDKSMAVIHFNMDGTIIKANENFLQGLGYSEDEIFGRHHKMFVDPEYAGGSEYAEFWARLNQGEYQAGQFKRISKSGEEVWIEASYNPIMDASGKPFKVVKFATVITGQVNAIQNVLSNVTNIESSIREVDLKANTASRGASESSENVSTVASAIEELNASVAEISQSMAYSGKAVHEAIDQTDRADEAVSQLAQAATSMNGIVELIQGIAGQINLLSLNATIESARAGEAGKGFAVVAGEVKNLAKQATDATEQINFQIAEVQNISKNVVDRLAEIKASIHSVEAYVTSTASAVEEQNVATRNISSNIQATAVAAKSISEGMVWISSAVEQTTGMVNRTRSEAMSLRK